MQMTQPFLSRTFRSLRNRNYRLYFIGQAISSSGTWVQLVAEHWLVIRLGGGGIALGVTTALQFTPLLFLGPYAGVLVDRLNKRRLLLVTQSANGILALTLGILALAGLVQIWMVWLAALLVGCVNSFDNPGRQTLTRQIVGLSYVANAEALNTAIANAARAIGPAIGGLLVAGPGFAACFLVNAASYGVVVAALRMMDESQFLAQPPIPRRAGQLREGFRHVRSHPVLWGVLLIVTIVSTFGLNYQVVLPVFVSKTFQYGAALYGAMMSVLGIGSLAGALLAATWTDPTLGRVGALATAFGIASIGVAMAPTFPVALLAVGILGVLSGLFLSSSTGCLQLNTAEAMRGRVMALYYVAFLGVSPVSGPFVGWIAQAFGARAAFWLAAVACIPAGTVALLVRARFRTA